MYPVSLSAFSVWPPQPMVPTLFSIHKIQQGTSRASSSLRSLLTSIHCELLFKISSETATGDDLASRIARATSVPVIQWAPRLATHCSSPVPSENVRPRGRSVRDCSAVDQRGAACVHGSGFLGSAQRLRRGLDPIRLGARARESRSCSPPLCTFRRRFGSMERYGLVINGPLPIQENIHTAFWTTWQRLELRLTHTTRKSFRPSPMQTSPTLLILF